MKSNDRVVGRRREICRQQRAHVLDPLAHLRQFPDPGLPQRRVREDACRNRGAMVGRHGVDAARDLQHVAVHGVGSRFILAHHDQRADAFAIQPEVLGVRYGDERFGKPCRRPTGRPPHPPPDRCRIPGRPGRGTAPAAAAASSLDQRLPLPHGQIRAGRVMAAGVHQDHVARRCALQAVDHRVESQLMRLCIVVWVALQAAAPSRRAAACGCPRSDRSRAPWRSERRRE